jgi:polyvinyl alcohol dehydrogenase (cytochrome)
MGHVVSNAKHRARRYGVLLAGLVLILSMAVVGIVYLPRHDVHAATGDWPTFLGGNARTGFNAAESVINPTTAPNLKLKWTAQTKGHVSSEPLVVNGVIYWGSWDGLMHATDGSTGKDIWATNIGTKPGSCGQNYGIVGTSTVATVTVAGVVTQAVFVAGGQDNVLALDTTNGHIIWQTNLGNTKGEFLYSSTSVYNNSVYVGVSSFGDCPLVQGQVVQLDASTGTLQNTFNVVPAGCTGGAVWGSLTIDEATGMLYFGTGNAGKCKKSETLAPALIELNSANLSLVASWPVPSLDGVKDGDYGSTPTLFQATINSVQHQMVGLVNKDGYYYALDRTNISAGSLWKVRISIGGSGPETGDGSISASAYDGTNLYVGGGKTTINGQQCIGSLRAMDPNTGSFHWEMCFSSPVLDPIVAVTGLVVVGWSNNIYVVNSATGQNVFTYQDTGKNAKFWSAATIANGVLYDGSRSGSVFAFQVS